MPWSAHGCFRAFCGTDERIRSGSHEARGHRGSAWPVSGNITQTGYFVLGGLTAIALCVLLCQENRLESIRRGFLLWCSVHVVFGLLDLLGKVAGAGDILSPIRTASYAMLTRSSKMAFGALLGPHRGIVPSAAAHWSASHFVRLLAKDKSHAWLRHWAFLLLVLLLLSTSSVAMSA